MRLSTLAHLASDHTLDDWQQPGQTGIVALAPTPPLRISRHSCPSEGVRGHQAKRLHEEGLDQLPDSEILSKAKTEGAICSKSHPKVITWHNRLEWARRILVKKGFLSGNSDWGMWEITDAGRRRLGTAK